LKIEIIKKTQTKYTFGFKAASVASHCNSHLLRYQRIKLKVLFGFKAALAASYCNSCSLIGNQKSKN
jgi:hypothetical protein